MSPKKCEQHKGNVENAVIKCKHILDLTKEQKVKFLDSFDIILSDCDGVVWMFVEPLPNTGRAIMLLKEANKQFKFISNNSMRTDQEYMEKLTDIGVRNVQPTDIVHPVKTIVHYIKHQMPQGQRYFSLCCHEVNAVLAQNDIELQMMQPNIELRPNDLLSVIKPNDTVAAVIIDLNFNITFSELARAHQYLQADDCRLLVGAADGLVPVTKGFTTIGSADFIRVLCERSGKAPVMLGKPGALLGAHLVERYHIERPQRALFIGDNLEMDIKFGLSCGFQTLFVLSGASTYQQMLNTTDKFQPNYIANSLADFIEFFDDLNE